MRLLPGAATALLLMFVSACGQRPPAKELPPPAAIRSFKADKDQIRAGEAVRLSWTADHATSLELVDQSGSPIPTEGTATAGSAVVKPLSTQFYVLRVRGEGGGHSAFVQVAVDEDLKEVFLVAVPKEINAGESALLLWSAFHATEAKLQTTAGGEQVLDAAAGSGIVEVTPERTASYTLTARGSAIVSPLTATTDVKVRPVVLSFQASPQAAKPGETITFSWKTRGAAEVLLSESTFGDLNTVSVPAETSVVDEGSFTWTVPGTLHNGKEVLETHPLHFTLEATTSHPAVSATREIQGYVGEGPQILELNAPAAITEGRGLTLRWRTRNATRLQVLSNGAPVYEPLPKDTAEIAKGELHLAALSQDTILTVKVWSHLGAESTKQASVRVVKVPSIAQFTLPAQINSLGDSANATWTTTDASRVVIRTKNGPTVFSTDELGAAAQGHTSVYPGGRQTTFVLEAYNDAGDVDSEERTVIVAIPGDLTATPSPVTRGEAVDVTWTLPTGAVSHVIGDPRGMPSKSTPGTSFVDLATQANAGRVVFDHPDDDVQLVSFAKPLRFPFLGTVNERFWISTNGFVSFAQTEPLPENGEVGTAAAPLPPMIAPFWDDLRLGSGEVLYLVEGTQFPRRLIIQWNKVQTGAKGSELTFQVQLFETGEFRFAYKSLTGGEARGESATIGWHLQDGLGRNVAGTGGMRLSDGDEYDWFVSTAVDGQLSVVASNSGAYSLYGLLPGGHYAVFSAPVNVIAPGSVKVNEIMVLAEAHAPQGRWIELANLSGETVDLSGTVLLAVQSNTTVTLPDGVVLQPGELVVVGESMDPTENGGAEVDHVWGALQPANNTDDTIVLNASLEVSRLEYTISQIAPGISVVPPEDAVDAQNGPLSCPRTRTFGPQDALGTPNARNETCFLYVKAPIAGKYRDISATGTPLFDPGLLSITNLFRNDVELGAYPIPFYGKPQSKVHVSVHGYVSFGSITENFDNYFMPGVNGSPVHAAVMWDRLEKRPSSDGNVFMQRFNAGEDPLTPAPHWIFQWHQLSHYEWGSANDDDLNFQVKFFDDGAIEYHYGTLRNGNAGTLFADGRDATVWLESDDSTMALPIGRLQPVLRPNTAYRFTPNP